MREAQLNFLNPFHKQRMRKIKTIHFDPELHYQKRESIRVAMHLLQARHTRKCSKKDVAE